MKLRGVILIGLLSLGMLVVLYGGFGRNPREVPFMLRGKPAPTFVVRRLDNGQPLRSEDVKGRPLVLNFWASWCAPCKTEHPVLEWAAREFGEDALFVGVVFEDQEEKAKAFLRRYGASFLQTYDPKSRMSVDYGVAGVPETYFVRADGTIQDKHVGPIDPTSMVRQLRALTGDAPAGNAEAAK